MAGRRMLSRVADVASSYQDADVSPSPSEGPYEKSDQVNSPTDLERLIEPCDPGMQRMVRSIFESIDEISYGVRRMTCNAVSCFYDLGGNQFAIDDLAVEVFYEKLRNTGVCEVASSMGAKVQTPLGGTGYSVAFNALDGSSIHDTNFAIGTVCGVWKGGNLYNVTGREIECAVMALYGPRTTIAISIKGTAFTHEFLLDEDAPPLSPQRWRKSATYASMQEGTLAAPGSIRSSAFVPGYKKLIDEWISKGYSMRYTGSMTADVHQIMKKGFGVFCHVTCPEHPAILHMLHEGIPAAYLVEKAGGASSQGEHSVLDVKVESPEQRSQIAVGTKMEIARFETLVGPAPEYGAPSRLRS